MGITSNKNILWGEKRGSLNVKSGDTYSDHWAYGIEAFKVEGR